ncbi:hypothetical protein ACAG96_06585 [Candidatus Izemoplasma sp. B36]|uniref:hypothetical protein n=1 Tax=Candidatus Izemoplasma sp. B36 TaxID=3242468 RepID=UPI003555CC60
MNIDEKKEAIKYFNKTWDFIEKEDRSPSENLEMIDLAFKSKYYWSLVGTKINFIRSNWQISRVFAEANLLEASLYYSKKCLEDTTNEKITGFDLFFAYEANVRVYHLMKRFDLRDNMKVKALESLDTIIKKEDKEYCTSELEKILKIQC